MKTYKTPSMELLALTKDDVLAVSFLENIGTVIDFSEGKAVAPGMDE